MQLILLVKRKLKLSYNTLTKQLTTGYRQTRIQGGTGGASPPLENFSLPLEKRVGHRLKLLDIVEKIWAPPRKLFAPPGVPSWLRAWL